MARGKKGQKSNNQTTVASTNATENDNQDISSSQGCVVGIDFGTTHASVGVYHNGKVLVLANPHGSRATPCVLSVDADTDLSSSSSPNRVGESASFDNTVRHLKPWLGLSFSDLASHATLSGHATTSLFTDNGSNVPVLSHVSPTLSPQAFCTAVLTELKQLAADFTGDTITQCVLTVPAHVSATATAALVTAASDAGLEVLAVLNEAVAACIAYDLDMLEESSGDAATASNCDTTCVLVYDMGGASTDVSLVEVHHGMFHVAATAHEAHVGGENFTIALVDHCLALFEKSHGVDARVSVQASAKSMWRLSNACESAKRALSQQTRVTIELDAITAGGVDLSVKISRSRFDDLIHEAVKSTTLRLVNQVLSDAQLDKHMVDRVLCVGGSVLIPLVQRQVTSFFDDSVTVDVGASPETMITMGATTEGSIVVSSKDEEEVLSPLESLPAVPLNLGIATSNGLLKVMLSRDDLLPAVATVEMTPRDSASFSVSVYEGQRVLTKDNTHLGTLVVDTSSSSQTSVVEVTLRVDRKGNASVSARVVMNSPEDATTASELTLPLSPTRLSEAAIATLLEDAEQHAAADEAAYEALESVFEKEEADAVAASVAALNLNDTASLPVAAAFEDDMD